MTAVIGCSTVAGKLTSRVSDSQWFTHHGSKELDTPKRLASGALAGITSVCASPIIHRLAAASLMTDNYACRFNIPLRPRALATVNSHGIGDPHCSAQQIQAHRVEHDPTENGSIICIPHGVVYSGQDLRVYQGRTHNMGYDP